MRCPACTVENAEGATVCASCGKDMTAAADAPAAQAAPASAPAAGRRLSRLAVLALIAASIAPSMQVQRDLAGGRYFGTLAKNPMFLMGLDVGANVLFAIAIIAGIVALAQVIRRSDLRGGALAVGGLVLALGGMASSTYGSSLEGRAGELLRAMGGGSETYVWRTTVIVLGAAVLSEIVLILFGRRAPAEEKAPEEPVAAQK